MSQLYSFKWAKEGVTVEGNSVFIGNELYSDTFNASHIALSRFPDVYHGYAEEIHGFKGEDLIFSENPEVVMYGDAGPDTLLNGHEAGGTAYGGSGDDYIRANDMTGGKGSDTFQLTAEYSSVLWFTNYDATIHDFEPGEDLLQIVVRDPNAYLTNEGDVWTVHSDDPNYPGEGEFTASFTVEGVTELSPNDYDFSVLVG